MIKNLNFILIVATIAVLSALGIVFILGSGYSWAQSLSYGDWTQTPAYQEYVNGMNLAVVPLAVALVVVTGLCIPKRIFSGVTLLQAMGGLVTATLIAAVFLGPRLGLSLLLAAAVLTQLVVIALTLAGSKRLTYETQGFFVQMGSALLHLGFIIFLFDFILLGESPAHLDIFWLATVLIGVGMVLCFYSGELSRLRKPALQPTPQPDD